MTEILLGSTHYRGFSINPHPEGRGYWVSYGGVPVGKHFSTIKAARLWIDNQ